MQETHEQPKQRCLARPIGSEKPKHGTVRNLKRDLVESRDGIESLGEGVDRDHETQTNVRSTSGALYLRGAVHLDHVKITTTLGIVVKPSTTLPAQMSGQDHAAQERGSRVAGIFILLVHGVGDEQAGV